MALLEDLTSHEAEKLVKFLHFVLSFLGKDVKNMVALLGDKCNVN